MNRRLYLLLALAIAALSIACGTPPETPAVDDVESGTSGAIDLNQDADSESATEEEAEEAVEDEPVAEAQEKPVPSETQLPLLPEGPDDDDRGHTA